MALKHRQPLPLGQPCAPCRGHHLAQEHDLGDLGRPPAAQTMTSQLEAGKARPHLAARNWRAGDPCTHCKDQVVALVLMVKVARPPVAKPRWAARLAAQRLRSRIATRPRAPATQLPASVPVLHPQNEPHRGVDPRRYNGQQLMPQCRGSDRPREAALHEAAQGPHTHETVAILADVASGPGPGTDTVQTLIQESPHPEQSMVRCAGCVKAELARCRWHVHARRCAAMATSCRGLVLTSACDARQGLRTLDISKSQAHTSATRALRAPCERLRPTIPRWARPPRPAPNKETGFSTDHPRVATRALSRPPSSVRQGNRLTPRSAPLQYLPTCNTRLFPNIPPETVARLPVPMQYWPADSISPRRLGRANANGKCWRALKTRINLP